MLLLNLGILSSSKEAGTWSRLAQVPTIPSPSQMSSEPSTFSWNMRQVQHANSKNRTTGKEGTPLAVACPCPQTAPREVSTLSSGYLKDMRTHRKAGTLGRPTRSFLEFSSQTYTYPSVYSVRLHYRTVTPQTSQPTLWWHQPHKAGVGREEGLQSAPREATDSLHPHCALAHKGPGSSVQDRDASCFSTGKVTSSSLVPRCPSSGPSATAQACHSPVTAMECSGVRASLATTFSKSDVGHVDHVL